MRDWKNCTSYGRHWQRSRTLLFGRNLCTLWALPVYFLGITCILLGRSLHSFLYRKKSVSQTRNRAFEGKYSAKALPIFSIGNNTCSRHSFPQKSVSGNHIFSYREFLARKSPVFCHIQRISVSGEQEIFYRHRFAQITKKIFIPRHTVPHTHSHRATQPQGHPRAPQNTSPRKLFYPSRRNHTCTNLKKTRSSP